MAKKMRSVMSHNFNQIPHANIQRSRFDRSHGHKTTFDAGALIPIYVDEALPGDTFNLKMSALARLATPIKPIMDNMFMETFFFAVPNRLVWDNWQKFNGEQDNPGDSTDFVIPTFTHDTGVGENSIYDYMGIPPGVPGITFNALHLRAYNLIWNEFFRDQNLQESNEVNKGDGPDDAIPYVLKARGKRHDYFTSCLPWPQKGEAVEIPLGGTAPVLGNGEPTFEIGTIGNLTLQAEQPLVNAEFGGFASSTSDNIASWDDPALIADLTDATAITINALRESFQIQKLYERDARGGTRYTEIIKSHFGVTSPDSRLQRPEYLGGGSSPINITPIAQTTQDIDGPGVNTPQANLAAVGTSTANNHGFTKSFTEHCVLIGMVCVRADLTYQRGLNRMYSRQSRFDYYWPALSHLGEQEVLNKEIYIQDEAVVPGVNDAVFGYQERYAEYRYKPSEISGQFRSTAAASLDVWHLSQDFADLPALNNVFIAEDVPVDRVIAVQSEPHFLFDSYFDLKCARPMPTYAVPGLIDHF